MRKLLAALLFFGTLGVPTMASADDGWRDRDRREWRDDRWDDRRWRGDRWEHRRDWRDRRWSHRENRWDRRRWRDDRRHRYNRYARRDVVCRTYWDHYGYPERVCWRH